MKEEKYIKDKLTDYQSPMDMDGMWANLEEELDKGKKDRGLLFYLRSIISVLAILVLAGIIYYTVNLPNTKNTISENKTTTIIDTKKEQVETSISTEDISKVQANSSEPTSKPDSERLKTEGSEAKENKAETKTPTAETKQSTSQSTNQTSKFNSRNNSNNNTQLNSTAKTKPRVKNTNSETRTKSTASETTKQQETSIKKDLDKSAKSKVIENSIKSTNDNQAKSKSTITTTDQSSNTISNVATAFLKIAVLPAGLLAVQDRLLPEPKEVILDLEPIDPKPIEARKWRISLNGGTTKSYINHDKIFNEPGDTTKHWTQYRNEAESEIFLPSFGIKLEKRKANGIKFSTGINYNNHGVRFAHKDTLRGENILDTSSTLVISEVTPEGLLINTGVVDAQRDVARTICSDNTLHTIQVPFLVGYEARKNKFDCSLSAGLNVNYMFSQSGISYAPRSQNEFIDISVENNSTYNLSTLLLGAQAEIQLGYMLGDKWRMYSSFEYGLQLFNSSIGNIQEEGLNLDTRIKHFGLRTGISYSF